MKKEIRKKIEAVFKEFPDINIDEFKFVIDALAELFEAEKEKWQKERIMAIDKRVLEGIRKEQGTDEFQETIIKPIEKRVKEELLERIKLKEETKLFDEDDWSDGYKGGYNQAIADLEKLKEEIRNENKNSSTR